MVPVRTDFTGLAGEALSILARSARDPRYGARTAKRAVAMLRAQRMFRGCALGPRVTADGKVLVENRGSLSIGKGAHFMGGMFPSRLRTAPAGSLTIGEQCVFNYGVSIEADQRVQIGNGCLFGSMVQLFDRSLEAQGPVVIGDEVWVAHGVVIHPGVRVGDGAVLSAGAVVTRDVPAGHLAIGNPARTMLLATVKGAR